MIRNSHVLLLTTNFRKHWINLASSRLFASVVGLSEPLGLGEGGTIPSPYILAYVLEAIFILHKGVLSLF